MKFKLFMLSVVAIVIFALPSTANARSLSSEQVQAKKTYYHTKGYISAIWKNARRTVYHPDKHRANRWWAALHYLENRNARAWKILHPDPKPTVEAWLEDAFFCIHRYEGAWNANTGNGYYGGLQMDLTFQSSYGPDYIRQWGTADNWPVWAQINAAVRAYRSGRGFYPWPNTARVCGLI